MDLQHHIAGRFRNEPQATATATDEPLDRAQVYADPVRGLFGGRRRVR
jgi:hypothetical protein